MFLLYAWACIIVRVNQYCSTLTSVFNMYFSYLIHYLFYCNFPALLSATQNSLKFIRLWALPPSSKQKHAHKFPM